MNASSLSFGDLCQSDANLDFTLPLKPPASVAEDEVAHCLQLLQEDDNAFPAQEKLLSEESEKLASIVASIQSKQTVSGARVDAVDSKLKALEGRVESMETARYTDDLDFLRSKQSASDSKLKALEGRIDSMETTRYADELDSLRSKQSTSDSKLKALEGRIDSMEIAKYTDDLDFLRSKQSASDSKIKALESRVASLEADLLIARGEDRAHMDAMETELRSFKARLNIADSKIRAMDLTTGSLRVDMSLHQHRLEDLEATEKALAKDIYSKIEALVDRVDRIFPPTENSISPLSRWEAIVDEFESVMFQAGAAAITDASQYFRSFMKDTAYFLRRARNNAIEVMGQPLPAEEKQNNQDRRGMTDIKLGTEDVRQVRKTKAGGKAKKVIRIVKRTLVKRDAAKSMETQLDKLQDYAANVKDAVGGGLHKDSVYEDDEVPFHTLESLISAPATMFSATINRLKDNISQKKSLFQYKPISTFKPKTDLRRRRVETDVSPKKKAKRSSADDVEISDDDESYYSEQSENSDNDQMAECGLVEPLPVLPMGIPAFVSSD